MMRLSDVVGRVTSPTVMISVALLLFFFVFLAVVLYAYVLLGRGTERRFASMPLQDSMVLVPMDGADASQADTESIEPVVTEHISAEELS